MYMDMRLPTDEELEHLTHVTMTGENPWDPSVYDQDAQLDLEQDSCQAEKALDDDGCE